MPYRILCNGTFQKSQKARSGLGLASSRRTSLHNNRYGVCYFRSNCFAPSCTASLQRDILDYRETKYRIPQMCSYTILGLRPIENLKARKELVIRCTKHNE